MKKKYFLKPCEVRSKKKKTNTKNQHDSTHKTSLSHTLLFFVSNDQQIIERKEKMIGNENECGGNLKGEEHGEEEKRKKKKEKEIERKSLHLISQPKTETKTKKTLKVWQRSLDFHKINALSDIPPRDGSAAHAQTALQRVQLSNGG